jgi:acyl-coenzyme A thioesterase PaaI-like protein
VLGRVTLTDSHSGAPGYAHGGVVAAVLDDVVGMVPIVVLAQAGVTARLEIDYRQPALLGHVLETRAWIERLQARKVWVRAVVCDQQQPVAEARALLVLVERAHFLEDFNPVGEWYERWRLANSRGSTKGVDDCCH